MARNFKRDRKGRFSKVAGMKGSSPRPVRPAGANKSRAVSSHKAARAAIKKRKGSGGGSTARNAILAAAVVTAGAVASSEIDRIGNRNSSPLKFVDGMLLAQRRRGVYNVTTIPRRR